MKRQGMTGGRGCGRCLARHYTAGVDRDVERGSAADSDVVVPAEAGHELQGLHTTDPRRGAIESVGAGVGTRIESDGGGLECQGLAGPRGGGRDLARHHAPRVHRNAE